MYNEYYKSAVGVLNMLTAPYWKFNKAFSSIFQDSSILHIISGQGYVCIKWSFFIV